MNSVDRWAVSADFSGRARKIKTVVIVLLCTLLTTTIAILFANFMVKHDDNSSYNLDKQARAICKELRAEFRKVGYDRFCIRDDEVVWP